MVGDDDDPVEPDVLGDLGQVHRDVLAGAGGGFTLLDSQYIVGEHMLQFGTIEIPRAEYKRRLHAALLVETTF